MSEVEKYWNSNKDIWVYTGPSLSMEETAQLAPDVTVLPPAKRGDFQFKPGAKQPKVIVLIDGAFLNTLTVSPREILSLMDQGIKVIGSSSLGAIRATELEKFGMVGVGKVFEMYRDEIIIADDEVAMSMDPSTGNALSEPLVHIRVIIEKAVESGTLNEIESMSLFNKVQKLYFPKRTLDIFLSFASESLTEEKYKKLLNITENYDYRIKKIDAINAINKAIEILNQENK
ncbi:TfuA-like protein [Cytobacillus sp. IB215665]|uniref:TfuA-like protein n=1 Tax=Cytobacillus sp. IB215665 TaxID=3097357 RepID=UPI002A17DF76|nr:TfuA-like protein [Cytobacillus sp. IB215665]MDX8367009.1 TfuA-like protein [Cytobacillus sp. IB215665]